MILRLNQFTQWKFMWLSENFECGLCEEIFVEEKALETHLRTCETYECRYCWKRVKSLSDIKIHIQENHADYTTLNHLKIDRESEFNVTSTTQSQVAACAPNVLLDICLIHK